MTSISGIHLEFGLSYVVYLGEGQVRIFGMFYVEWIPLYDTTPFITAWVGFVWPFTNILFSPFVGHNVGKWSMRGIVFASGLVGVVGMTIAAFAPTIGWVIFGYGILYGISDGMSMSVALSLVNVYFDKHLALASGIVWCAGSFGGITLPFIVEALTKAFTTRGCLLILAGLRLNLCVAAMVLRPVKYLKRKEVISENEIGFQGEEEMRTIGSFVNEDSDSNYKEKLQEEDSRETNSRGMSCCRKCNSTKSSWVTAVFSVRFLTFAVFWFFGLFSFYIIIQFMPPYFGEHKLGQYTAVLLGISGGADLAGRLVFGITGDLKCTNVNLVVTLCVCMCGLMTLVVGYYTILPVLVIFMIVMGGLGNSLWGLYGPLVVDAIGATHAGLGAGIVNSLFGIGTTIGPVMAGWLKEATGSYTCVLYMGGVSYLIAVFTFIFVGKRIYIPKCIRNRGQNVRKKSITV